MDAERERVEAGDPLMALFHEVGRIKAPIELEQRILSQLAPSAAPSAATSSLIAPRAWYAILVGALVAVLLGVLLPGQEIGTDQRFVETMELLRIPVLTELLYSQWTLMTVTGIFFLMIMDRFLSKRSKFTFLF